MTSPERRPALKLRPYQEEAINTVERALERGVRRPLIVLPTGTGKTQVFASLIARRGGSALVLAHRDELLRQAAEKIRFAKPELGLAVGFVAAQRDDIGAPVVVASVQTLAQARRLQRLPRQFDTVVVDFTSRPFRVRLTRSRGCGAVWRTQERGDAQVCQGRSPRRASPSKLLGGLIGAHAPGIKRHGCRAVKSG